MELNRWGHEIENAMEASRMHWNFMIELNRTQSNSLEPNQTHCEPNRTQSKLIERSIWFDWPNFFCEGLIVFDYRTQSNPIAWLGSIGFD